MSAETDTSQALAQALEDSRAQTRDAEKRIQDALEKVRRLEKSQAAQMINLKYELSKEILEQANAPITRATQALTLILSIVVIGGSLLTYFVSNNLQTTFESHMKQRVESWLSLENESSIVNRTLDTYRTRALLDSYMIQLARRKARGESMVNLDFRKGDESRLLSIIEAKDSQTSDFLDALKLLSVARGGWVFGARNDTVSLRLRALFRDAEFDNNRKLYILEIMDRDEGLVPIAASILQNSGQPQPFKFQAFKMLREARQDSEEGALAHRYALEQLAADQEPDRTLEAVKYLADVDPFSPVLTAFLQQLETQPRASRIEMRAAVAAGWIGLLPHPTLQSMADLDKANPPADRAKLRQLIAENLSLAMRDGLGIGVIDNISGKPGLSMQFTHTSGTINHIDFPLERLFTDTQLLSVLFDLEQPDHLVSFARLFNTVNRDERVTSLRLSVPAGAFDTVQRQALGEQVEVQLRVSPEGALHYRWTDNNGDVHQQAQLSTFKPSAIKVMFDREYLIYKAPYDTWMF